MRNFLKTFLLLAFPLAALAQLNPNLNDQQIWGNGSGHSGPGNGLTLTCTLTATASTLSGSSPPSMLVGTSHAVAQGDCGLILHRCNASTMNDTFPVGTTSGFGSGFGVTYQNGPDADNSCTGGGVVSITSPGGTINGSSSPFLIPLNTGCDFTSFGTTDLKVSSCTAIAPAGAATSFSPTNLTAGMPSTSDSQIFFNGTWSGNCGSPGAGNGCVFSGSPLRAGIQYHNYTDTAAFQNAGVGVTGIAAFDGWYPTLGANWDGFRNGYECIYTIGHAPATLLVGGQLTSTNVGCNHFRVFANANMGGYAGAFGAGNGVIFSLNPQVQTGGPATYLTAMYNEIDVNALSFAGPPMSKIGLNITLGSTCMRTGGNPCSSEVRAAYEDQGYILGNGDDKGTTYWDRGYGSGSYSHPAATNFSSTLFGAWMRQIGSGVFALQVPTMRYGLDFSEAQFALPLSGTYSTSISNITPYNGSAAIVTFGAMSATPPIGSILTIASATGASAVYNGAWVVVAIGSATTAQIATAINVTCSSSCGTATVTMPQGQQFLGVGAGIDPNGNVNAASLTVGAGGISQATANVSSVSIDPAPGPGFFVGGSYFGITNPTIKFALPSSSAVAPTIATINSALNNPLLFTDQSNFVSSAVGTPNPGGPVNTSCNDGDVLTVSNGTKTTAATITVHTDGSGHPISVTYAGGAYTVMPGATPTYTTSGACNTSIVNTWLQLGFGLTSVVLATNGSGFTPGVPPYIYTAGFNGNQINSTANLIANLAVTAAPVTFNNGISTSGVTSTWANFTSGADPVFGSEQVLFNGIFAPTQGSINALSSPTGTGTNGTYTGVSLTGGTGSGAAATVVVAGGVVTSVTSTTGGTGYTHGDVLSFTVTGGSGEATVNLLGGMQGIRDIHKYSGMYHTSVQDYQINSTMGFYNGETPYQTNNYNGGLVNMGLDSSLNTLNGLKPPPVQQWELCNAWTDTRPDVTWNPVTFFACNLTDAFINGNGATSLSASITGATGTGAIVTYTFPTMATVAKFGDIITVTGTNGALYDQSCTVGGAPPTLTSITCVSTKTGTWTSGGTLVWQPTIYNMAHRFNNNNGAGGINSVNNGANRYNIAVSYADMPTNTASAGNDYEMGLWLDGECSAATGSGSVFCRPIWVTTIGADNEVWGGFNNTPIGNNIRSTGAFTTITAGGNATWQTGSSTASTTMGNPLSSFIMNAGSISGTSIWPVANGGTGTGSTLTGLMRGNASAMTAAEISGDCTTSGSNAIACTKSNGTAITPAENVQTFSYTGSGQTWTKPATVNGASCQTIRVIMVGGGGGGGSGAAITSGTASSGGSGGGGSTLVDTTFPCSAAGSTVTVTIGQGGQSVAGVTGNVAGNNGAAGAATLFGTLATAYGGGGGAGGQSAGASAGGAGASWNGAGASATNGTAATGVGGAGNGNSGVAGGAATSPFAGSGGAGGVNGLAGVAGGNAQEAGAGGGSGGGLATTPVSLVGGAGGKVSVFSTAGAAGAAAGLGGTGGSATGWQGGAGGGGGGSSATTTGGAGGPGGTCGGAGGGGGSAIGTQTSGASGSGGNGCAWIITTY